MRHIQTVYAAEKPHSAPSLPVGERIDLNQGREVTEAPEIREDLVETQGQGKLYERMGTVYKDPETGQLFMLTESNVK